TIRGTFPLAPSRRVLIESELVFDLPDIAAKFGQASQAEQDAFLLAFRFGGRSEHALARRHVADHAGAGTDDGLVLDVDVIGHADLAGQNDVVAGAARTGDADLADKQVVLADLTVVADLHEVIDLGARADARGLEGAAVDGRAGANFHIVAN